MSTTYRTLTLRQRNAVLHDKDVTLQPTPLPYLIVQSYSPGGDAHMLCMTFNKWFLRPTQSNTPNGIFIRLTIFAWFNSAFIRDKDIPCHVMTSVAIARQAKTIINYY